MPSCIVYTARSIHIIEAFMLFPASFCPACPGGRGNSILAVILNRNGTPDMLGIRLSESLTPQPRLQVAAATSGQITNGLRRAMAHRPHPKMASSVYLASPCQSSPIESPVCPKAFAGCKVGTPDQSEAGFEMRFERWLGAGGYVKSTIPTPHSRRPPKRHYSSSKKERDGQSIPTLRLGSRSLPTPRGVAALHRVMDHLQSGCLPLVV